MLATYPTINPRISFDFTKAKSISPNIICERAGAAEHYSAFNALRMAPTNMPLIGSKKGGNDIGLISERASTNLYPVNHQFDSAGLSTMASNIGSLRSVIIGGIVRVMCIESNTTNTFAIRKYANMDLEANTFYTKQLEIGPGTCRFVNAIVVYQNKTTLEETVFSCFIDTLTGESWPGHASNPALENRWVVNKMPNGNVFVAFTGMTPNNVSNGFSYIDIRTNGIDELFLENKTGRAIAGSNGRVSFAITRWQLERGTQASTFIMTRGSTATRPASFHRVNDLTFQRKYSKTVGAVFSDATLGEGTVWEIGPSANDRVCLEFSRRNKLGNGRILVRSGGSTVAEFQIVNAEGKCVFSYSQDKFFYANEHGEYFETNMSFPQYDAPLFRIGDSATAGLSHGGTIKKLAYYGAFLTKEQAAALLGL